MTLVRHAASLERLLSVAGATPWNDQDIADYMERQVARRPSNLLGRVDEILGGVISRHKDGIEKAVAVMVPLGGAVAVGCLALIGLFLAGGVGITILLFAACGMVAGITVAVYAFLIQTGRIFIWISGTAKWETTHIEEVRHDPDIVPFPIRTIIRDIESLLPIGQWLEVSTLFQNQVLIDPILWVVDEHDKRTVVLVWLGDDVIPPPTAP